MSVAKKTSPAARILLLRVAFLLTYLLTYYDVYQIMLQSAKLQAT